MVHLVDEAMLKPMAVTAEALPETESELQMAGLHAVDLDLPDDPDYCMPRIAEAPVAMACSYHSTVEVGHNRLVLGEIHAIWVRDGLVDGRTLRVHATAWAPVGRCESPDGYSIAKGRIHISSGRPALED